MSSDAALVLDNFMDYVYYSLENTPRYHLLFECLLCIGMFWMLASRRYKPIEREELTDREKEELIFDWKPEPLVPKEWQKSESLDKFFSRSTVGKVGKYITFSHRLDRPALNISTFNYLNFIGDSEIEQNSISTLKKYGVGSCGPRGFYGTMDVHLQLEQEIAKFYECEEAVVYSYGFSTVASAIPAYAKRTDIIFADEAVSFAIQKGLIASRSRIKYFRHNDMSHLCELLQEQAKLDLQNPSKAKVTRRFIVVEGLYLRHGDICPLNELIQLKYQYKVRIFLDESHSLGVFGETGRGVCEHFQVNTCDIDLITGSLENSLASCGGYAVGTRYVVDHQRLSGQGYCFSASLPPILVTSASIALKKLSNEASNRPLTLRNISSKFHYMLEDFKVSKYWSISGLDISPIKHIRLVNNNSVENLEQISEYALENFDIVLNVAKYLWDSEAFRPIPSIRLSLNCDLNDTELSRVIDSIVDSAKFFEETQLNINYNNSRISENSGQNEVNSSGSSDEISQFPNNALVDIAAESNCSE